jgi:predicted dehydrogenase
MKRWGLIGLGLQGKRIADAITAVGEPLATVIGSDPERAKEFAQAYEARAYADLAEALAEGAFDVLAVTSPDDRHAAECIEALEAGMSVLCEKPLARTKEECDAIAAAVARTGVRFFVDFHLRMHPAIQEARARIASGELGDISSIELIWCVGGVASAPPLPSHMQWREDPTRAAGGALGARGSHLFDLARYLTGDEVTAMEARAELSETGIDRTAECTMQLSRGTSVHILTSKITADVDNRIHIVGTKGTCALRPFSDPAAPLYQQVIEAISTSTQNTPTLRRSTTALLPLCSLFVLRIRWVRMTHVPFIRNTKPGGKRRARFPAGIPFYFRDVRQPTQHAPRW